MIKKKPIFGALPKLNMPQRTSIQKKNFEAYIPSNQTYIYHSLKEFCDRVSQLKSLDDWNVTLLFDRTLI